MAHHVADVGIDDAVGLGAVVFGKELGHLLLPGLDHRRNALVDVQRLPVDHHRVHLRAAPVHALLSHTQ
eukprot:scaffold648568_cov43-Prasinocladus_malaysianus.AAC.1